MITFLDGPAFGQALDLERTPCALRVVVNANGQWDALDQIKDDPKPDDTIHVYTLASVPGTVHIDYRDAQGRRSGKWLRSAQYRAWPQSVADEELRTWDAWTAWCLRNKVAILSFVPAEVRKHLELEKP